MITLMEPSLQHTNPFTSHKVALKLGNISSCRYPECRASIVKHHDMHFGFDNCTFRLHQVSAAIWMHTSRSAGEVQLAIQKLSASPGEQHPDVSCSHTCHLSL